MVKKSEEKRSPYSFPFQFVLKINGHIICQRGFYVRKFNEDVYLSYELREMMDTICGMGDKKGEVMGLIPKHLKAQSEDFMWDRYNPYFVYNEDKSKPRRMIRKDFFTFEITAGDFTISESKFENKFMLYSLENQVNITEIIPELIREIEYTFSMDEYEHNYLDVDLKYISPIWKYGESLRG